MIAIAISLATRYLCAVTVTQRHNRVDFENDGVLTSISAIPTRKVSKLAVLRRVVLLHFGKGVFPSYTNL